MEILDLLLKNGANINQSNNEGYTPLALAAVYGQVNTVKKLLENSPDLNKSYYQHQTPLYLAACRIEDEAYHSIAKLLITHSVATDKGDLEVIKRLDQYIKHLIDTEDSQEFLSPLKTTINKPPALFINSTVYSSRKPMDESTRVLTRKEHLIAAITLKEAIINDHILTDTDKKLISESLPHSLLMDNDIQKTLSKDFNSFTIPPEMDDEVTSTSTMKQGH